MSATSESNSEASSSPSNESESSSLVAAFAMSDQSTLQSTSESTATALSDPPISSDEVTSPSPSALDSSAMIPLSLSGATKMGTVSLGTASSALRFKWLITSN